MWKTFIANHNAKLLAPVRMNYETLSKAKHGSKLTYAYCMRTKFTSSIYKYFQKWIQMLNCDLDRERYYHAFLRLYKITNIVKLRNFRYRLLLNKIFVNDILFKWKITPNALCDWCSSKQSIVHLLMKCDFVQPLWTYVQQICQDKNCCWSDDHIILNDCYPVVRNAINIVTLITKYFIFQQKCLGNKPTKNGLIKEILFNINYDVQCSQELDKWSPIVNRCVRLKRSLEAKIW